MVEDELSLTPNALETLRARYLLRDDAGRIFETPAKMFERVARCVGEGEMAFGAARSEVKETVKFFFRLMLNGHFLPNSPTLMNANRRFGMLSACFVLPVPDSIEGIFDSVKNTAQVQRAGGGTGFSFDELRPTGDYISTSGGRTSGPISFWRVFCQATRAIQQGAFRRGANMAMMSVDHPDILKFISAKEDLSEFENFNISVKVADRFMKVLDEQPDRLHVVRNPRTKKQYNLPRDIDVGTYSLDDLVEAGSSGRGCYTVLDIWLMIVRCAWRSGEPGLCFIDRVNADNPTPALGPIEATNPCGEQPLLPFEACNLGSINLAKFIHDGQLDEPAFGETVRMAVRFLDDVIEVNNYIVANIDDLCRANRKIGLGIMGLADAFFKLGLSYDSDEAVEFGRRVAKLLRSEAESASESLAGRRGVFPNWRSSIWDTRDGRAIRNAAITAIAPTGTLSIIADCSGGIEPVYALAFYRRILEGRCLLTINPVFRRYAEAHGFWREGLGKELADGRPVAEIEGIGESTRRIFVTAQEIAPTWHVRMQAAFQEHIDGAISKTINLPNSATVEDVDAVYRLAYELKCKGVTVYRDRCRSCQPMQMGGAAVDVVACCRCGWPLASAGSCDRCPGCGAQLCDL